jgi:hypothetical protein
MVRDSHAAMHPVYQKPPCPYLPHQNSSDFCIHFFESGSSDFVNLAALVDIISVHSG